MASSMDAAAVLQGPGSDAASRRNSSGKARYYEMEVMLDNASEATQKSVSSRHVVPVFRLRAGFSASSFGVACARAADLPDRILLRAEAVTRHLRESGGGGWTRPAEVDSEAADEEVSEAARLFWATSDWKSASDDEINKLLALIASTKQ